MANNNEGHLDSDERSIDALFWLKSEIKKAEGGEALSPDEGTEVESFERALRDAPPSRILGRLDQNALEAMLDALPSESITVDLADRLRQRWEAARSCSPGQVIHEFRIECKASLEGAAAELGTSPSFLRDVEEGRAEWFGLAAENLARFAKAMNAPLEPFMIRLKAAARCEFIEEVRQRMQLKLGRHDALKAPQEALSSNLLAAMAVLRERNVAMRAFFDRAEEPTT